MMLKDHPEDVNRFKSFEQSGDSGDQSVRPPHLAGDRKASPSLRGTPEILEARLVSCFESRFFLDTSAVKLVFHGRIAYILGKTTSSFGLDHLGR
jgi:hypothetical protein